MATHVGYVFECGTVQKRDILAFQDGSGTWSWHPQLVNIVASKPQQFWRPRPESRLMHQRRRKIFRIHFFNDSPIVCGFQKMVTPPPVAVVTDSLKLAPSKTNVLTQQCAHKDKNSNSAPPLHMYCWTYSQKKCAVSYLKKAMILQFLEEA